MLRVAARNARLALSGIAQTLNSAVAARFLLDRALIVDFNRPTQEREFSWHG
jgi:hypothetical protein